ncbi:MAG: L,D-transpeptidase [Melioribacteraceae bacterium]|nr:L,D-transpeptidase [Melioribacteraceae bacterium]
MLRNIFYIMSSVILFFIGIVAYGIVINLRDVSLTDSMIEKQLTKITNPSIVIDRRNYTVELYSDTIMVKKYNAVFGRNNGSIKLSKNDQVTPIGKYSICRIDTNYTYYKKLYINYPNNLDAGEALKLKIINKEEFLAVINSNKFHKCPYDKTILGGEIGIQGIGEYNLIFKNLPFVFNWTNGSAAISNESIDELLTVVGIGTKVIIKN